MHSLSADMVSRIEYDEKEQECLAKDEQIQVNHSFFFFFFVSKTKYFVVFEDFTSQNPSS